MSKSRQNGITFGTSLLANSYLACCILRGVDLKFIPIDGGRQNLVDQSSWDRL